MKNHKKDNVIDITDRMTKPEDRSRFQEMKLRLQLENSKVALSTSLLSIVLLATLANNNLLSSGGTNVAALDSKNARGIASVSSVNEVTPSAEENQRMVKSLAGRDLSANAALGHQPSKVERLAFGVLEGKYAVRLQDGKLSEIEYNANEVAGADPKQIEDLSKFVDSQRDLLPVAYDRMLKTGSEKSGTGSVESFDLVNRNSLPLAKVQVRTDESGRLLVMRVAQVQIASK